MDDIFLFDRVTKEKVKEKIYGKNAILYLYKKKSSLAKFLRYCITHFSIFSRLFGLWQKTCFSKNKIDGFVKDFQIQLDDFEKNSYSSFNDFFIRKPKATSRPIAKGDDVASLPADARYLVFPNIEKEDGFYVKGQKFQLKELFDSCNLGEEYKEGSLVIGRLAPSDCHRFYFPCDCHASRPVFINGYLYSVNPIAVKQNIRIFSENKRMITTLHSQKFGKILYVEVGATNVGSIHQTYKPKGDYQKGDEKGYFSFGGSTVMLFFQKDKILFDQDLLKNSSQKIETKALMGQSLGRSLDI